MGYIELPTVLPDSKKFVISLWFRVPAASIAAAKAESDLWGRGEGVGPRPPMLGVIPLMVWGPRAQRDGVTLGPFQSIGTNPGRNGYFWDVSETNYPDCDQGTEQWGPAIPVYPPGAYTQSFWTADGTVTEGDPSFIGIDCRLATPKLSMNVVMPKANRPTISWYVANNVSFSSSAGHIDFMGGAGLCDPAGPLVTIWPGSGHPLCNEYVTNPPPGVDTNPVVTFGFADATETFTGKPPQSFRTLPDFSQLFSASTADINSGGTAITADHWHHMLLSLDISNPVIASGSLKTLSRSFHVGSQTGSESGTGDEPTYATAGLRTTSTAKLWLSLDDVNITERTLSAYWPGGYSNPNSILSVWGMNIACLSIFNITEVTDDCDGNRITRRSTGASKPSYSYNPEPIPFSVGTMGLPATSTYVNRVRKVEMGEFQLFTGVTLDTSKSLNRRAFITEEGRPAPMGDAEKLLLKKPERKLHGSKNWKVGKDTGSTADDPPIEGTHVGDIQIYKPNPNLNGDQGK